MYATQALSPRSISAAASTSPNSPYRSRLQFAAQRADLVLSMECVLRRDQMRRQSSFSKRRATETVHVARTNTHQPGLRCWYARPKPVARHQFIFVKFKFVRFDVDSNDILLIGSLH